MIETEETTERKTWRRDCFVVDMVSFGMLVLIPKMEICGK